MAAVVSSDTGMQVPPKTFDSIVIRTVQWQKVNLDTLPLYGCKAHSYLLRGMDAEVVQNDVNDLRFTIVLDQLPE